jgi:hypothetical protein
MLVDYNDYGLVDEPVDARSVREFFYSKYCAEQRSAASVVLSAYIGKHPAVFPDAPPAEAALKRVRR